MAVVLLKACGCWMLDFGGDLEGICTRQIPYSQDTVLQLQGHFTGIWSCLPVCH